MKEFLESAEQASSLLKAMSNQHRLLILCILVDGQKSVAEISPFIELSQSALSQHLKALKSAGLVTSNKAGLNVIYKLADDNVIKILATLKSIYCPDLPSSFD